MTTKRIYSANDSLLYWQKGIHEWAVGHGFWEGWKEAEPAPVHYILAKLMLVVTEIGEAAEAVRKGDDANYREEIADAIIRLLDLAEATGVDVGAEMVDKMMINEDRPYKHGKKA